MRISKLSELSGTHLYTWVERGTVRVKCLAQEHNTLSPARARTRSARSGVERTNHEATAINITRNVWELVGRNEILSMSSTMMNSSSMETSLSFV